MPNGLPCFLLLQFLCSVSRVMPATGAGLLPPPWDVSVDSVNMKHRLTWRPPEVSCGTVSYSVQFQGEFELRVLNGSWEEVQACHRISPHVCDLSGHLASDSDYELRVRAECGGAVSRWAHPPTPFNRKQTRLATPALSVHMAGSSAQVRFPDLPPALHLFLTHWRRGDELRASTVQLSVEDRPFHLSQLQEGATYCLRAQIRLPGSNRSASSDTHCFSIADSQPPWLEASIVCVAILVTMALLGGLLWCASRFSRSLVHSCCPEEPLPAALDCIQHHVSLGLTVHPQQCETFDAVLLLRPAQPRTHGSPGETGTECCQCSADCCKPLLRGGGGAVLTVG